MTERTTEELLGERGPKHGDFRVQFAIAQKLKEVCWECDNYWDMDPVLREVIDMSMLKWSRVLTGEWMFDDHWADNVGYGALGLKRVQELQKNIDMSWVDADAPTFSGFECYVENEPENE